MELLAELFFTAMAIVVQMGVPVVVIFVAAFVAERGKRRRLELRASGANGHALARFMAWLTAEEADSAGPLRASLCPSRGERQEPAPAPAPAAGVAACWQAMKADNGRLHSECVGCQSFLSPTTTR